MPSASPAIKRAVVELLPTLFPDDELDAAYGPPGSYQPDIIISVGDVRTTSTRPVHGTARAREEATDVTVIFSVYVAGDETVQQTATETAYRMRDTFADYFKVRGNETLGGACREAWVSADELAERVAIQPDSGEVTGRVAEITSTLSCATRV